jgi:hypothetical protein
MCLTEKRGPRPLFLPQQLCRKDPDPAGDTPWWLTKTDVAVADAALNTALIKQSYFTATPTVDGMLK